MRSSSIAFGGLFAVLLWIASSAARGKGLVVFAAGIVALLAAFRARGRGRPRALHVLFFVTLLAAATVLGIEAVLRLVPGVLRGATATWVLSGYHVDGDGIYRRDPHLGVALRPAFARPMYWNGHRWTHRTNSDGYRGPRLEQANAVFLGDSMIYGHGVEEEETVPARYQARSGQPAANLGQQGTCLVQAALIFRKTGARLAPRLVFVCAHFTDVDDALHWYAPDELERFVSIPGYAPRTRPEPPPTLFELWGQHVALPLRTGRLMVALLRRPGRAAAGPGEPTVTPGDAFLPDASIVEAPFAADAPPADGDHRLAWRAQRAAVAEIQRTAAAARARVVLFDVGYPTAFSRAVEEAARDLGVAYSPAGRLALDRARAGEPVYLPRDGHWTPQGSDVVARALLSDAMSRPLMKALGPQ